MMLLRRLVASDPAQPLVATVVLFGLGCALAAPSPRRTTVRPPSSRSSARLAIASTALSPKSPLPSEARTKSPRLCPAAVGSARHQTIPPLVPGPTVHSVEQELFYAAVRAK